MVLDMVTKAGYFTHEAKQDNDGFFSYLMDEKDEEIVKMLKDGDMVGRVLKEIVLHKIFKGVISEIREALIS